MENQDLLELNHEIWVLIRDLHHKISLVRQKELSQSKITSRQFYILRIIKSLGSDARLSAIAKETERKLDVISRQAALMEKDGLIKRIKDKPKSRLLRLELTKKGRAMLKISQYSKGMNEGISVLTEEQRRQLLLYLNQMLIKLNQYTTEKFED
jgi:DNA-binding MarR family transcriptional regulator